MFEVITAGKCPFCDKAKALLTEKGLNFTETRLTTPGEKHAFVQAGFSTVPQIYKNNVLIGGHAELVKYFEEQQLP